MMKKTLTILLALNALAPDPCFGINFNRSSIKGTDVQGGMSVLFHAQDNSRLLITSYSPELISFTKRESNGYQTNASWSQESLQRMSYSFLNEVACNASRAIGVLGHSALPAWSARVAPELQALKADLARLADAVVGVASYDPHYSAGPEHFEPEDYESGYVADYMARKSEKQELIKRIASNLPALVSSIEEKLSGFNPMTDCLPAFPDQIITII